MRDTVTVILAGGRGSRLEPLTRDRAKPAVPFGGLYRIIDFVLSNCLNSGMRRLLLLTQYKAQSLDRHINLAWREYFCRELGEFIDVVPPQQRFDDSWYEGTADAVYQNIYAIEREKPEYVVVLAGDHIYKMNYGPMVDFHRKMNADITIGALRVSRDEAREFGVMQTDSNHRVTGFQEKPEDPIPTPDDPDTCLASMGIYVFNARFLFEQLCNDAHPQRVGHAPTGSFSSQSERASTQVTWQSSCSRIGIRTCATWPAPKTATGHDSLQWYSKKSFTSPPQVMPTSLCRFQVTSSLATPSFAAS